MYHVDPVSEAAYWYGRLYERQTTIEQDTAFEQHVRSNKARIN